MQPVGAVLPAMPVPARILLTLAEGVDENAAFRWEVPASWNGGLVLFAHGYQGEGPGPGRRWTPWPHPADTAR